MRLMWFLTITLVAAASFTRAQNYYTPYQQLFAGFGPYLRQPINYGNQPDPRANTAPVDLSNQLMGSATVPRRPDGSVDGPVLFPPSPPTNPADTSGIIVGASGYGFVPPNPAFFPYFY